MKNKKTLSSFVLLGIGAAALTVSFFPPQVQAGGGWEINKKSYALSCSSVTVSGITNAPFVGIKVWGSTGMQNSLANNFTATAGDTSNAQTAGYKIGVKFAPQPNGTPIHFQVIGYLSGNASQPVNATPVSVVANCIDPNATPLPTPTASMTPAPSSVASSVPVASPTPSTTSPGDQNISWWEKIWQHLMRLFGRST